MGEDAVFKPRPDTSTDVGGNAAGQLGLQTTDDIKNFGLINIRQLKI